MSQYTVNQALEMKKSLIEKRNQLKDLVKESAVDRTTSFGGTLKEERAKYDVAEVDARLAQVEMAIFDLNSRIKASNAVTEIEVAFDFRGLMAGLKPLPQKTE